MAGGGARSANFIVKRKSKPSAAMSVTVSAASLILFIREQASSRRAWRVLFAATAADGAYVRIAQSTARRVIYMFVPRTCTRMPAALLDDVVCRLPEKARIRHTLVPTSPWTQISRSQNVRQIYLCTPEPRTHITASYDDGVVRGRYVSYL